MSRVVGLTACLLPLVLALGTSGASAEEGCSGTLCDFYYGTSSSFDDKPAAKKAPTPLMVPSGNILSMVPGNTAQQPASGQAAGTAPAPAKRPMVGVGGGGLAAMARGESTEQCSGTLCDFYYGKSSSFENTPQQAAAPTAAAAAPDAVTADAAPAQASLEMQGFHTRAEPPRCVGKARDPWSCYR